MRIDLDQAEKGSETFKYTDLPRLMRGLNPVQVAPIHHVIKAGDQDALIEDRFFVEEKICQNRSMTIEVHKDASLTFVHTISGRGAVVEDFRIKIAGGALNFIHLNTGMSLARTTIHVDLIDRDATFHLNGVQILNDGDHGDVTIRIIHRVSDTISNQLMRSIVDGSARGVFQGKVIVAPDAIRSDAQQLSNAILLSPLAEMDTKPELEIYADDVKCSHGATTGAMDDDQIFYLMSRGLDEKAARALLLQGFVSVCFEGLPEMVQQDLNEQAAKALDREQS